MITPEAQRLQDEFGSGRKLASQLGRALGPHVLAVIASYTLLPAVFPFVFLFCFAYGVSSVLFSLAAYVIAQLSRQDETTPF